MSAYTGRYVSSHGSSSNFAPLRVGEKNIGHHLNPLGVRTVLVGKTHIIADQEGMERLGVDAESAIGVHHAQAGFEVYERDDGVHPDTMVKPNLKYNKYLKSKGYDEDENPWHWAANSVETQNGVRSGFFNDQVDLPARVSDQDSETPYMTRRAIEFLSEDNEKKPWLLHLSYIKPHWPYVAPAPYNSMYSVEDVIPPNKAEHELKDPNQLMGCFMNRVAGKTFGEDCAREKVIPVYMGLITQIDDQLGILFEFMEANGLMENTMIVFTSDHGDYLGDHWMGDKDYFHDPSVKIPMIIADPSEEANKTRGTTDDSMVELIDLLPTFLEFYEGSVEKNVLDGFSLLPKIRGREADWRSAVVSEYDYSCQVFRPELERMPLDCRSYMIADEKWKYIHAPGFPPVLFDRVNDPAELNDLGRNPEYEHICDLMFKKLADWSLQYRQRETWTEDKNLHMTGLEEQLGVIIGYWDEKSAEGKDPKILPKRNPILKN